MPIIGIEKLYVAKQTKDDITGITYAVPKYYAGVQTLGIKPKQNTEKLFAENILWDQATTLDSVDIEVDLADLTSAQRVELLGQTTAVTGGVYATGSDIAPYVALLYKATLRGGAKRYGVLYKGAFQLPDDNLEGQEGKVKFQAPKVKALFQTTQYNAMWEYHVDSTDPNCPVGIDSTWFTVVTIPTVDTTAPTVITTPADAAAAVAITANMIWTFNEPIDVTNMNAANFFLLKATDGTLVPGALTLDGTSKIVTLDPTVSLTAATAYIAICTTNVSDVAGNYLVASSVTNFTTA